MTVGPDAAPATSPARRRTAPRDVRRKQLILAAMDSIAKRGFSDTTLRHVTEKAKLSHGVVNYHFESKEALYDATLGYLAQEHFDLWQQRLAKAGDDPRHQLRAIIEADFDKKVCTHRKMAVWFAFWGQAKYRPNYLSIHNKYDIKRDEELQRICAELIRLSGDTELTAVAAAHTIEAMIDGHWLGLMLYPDGKTPETCLYDCMITVLRLFPGQFSSADLPPQPDCA